jgi:hypothetical protein
MTLMRQHRLISAVAVATALIASAGCSDNGYGANKTTTTKAAGDRFVVKLTGAAVAPQKGDPDASGTATITLDDANKRICVTIELKGIDGLGPVHLSRASAGEEGPIVAELSDPSVKDLSKRRCVPTQPPQIFADVVDDPSDFYVIVRNQEFPLGALRGQLADGATTTTRA